MSTHSGGVCYYLANSSFVSLLCVSSTWCHIRRLNICVRFCRGLVANGIIAQERHLIQLQDHARAVIFMSEV